MVGESCIKKQKQKRSRSETQDNTNNESGYIEKLETVTELDEDFSQSSLTNNTDKPKNKKKKKTKIPTVQDESEYNEKSETVTEHNENFSHSSLRNNADEPKKKKKKKKTEVHTALDESQYTEKSEPEYNEDFTNSSLTRHSESDSDNTNEPKRKKKKKKKTEIPTTQSNNKKKSIRQAKREKFAQRQADNLAAAKEQIKSECMNYLSQWKHNRQNWKFMKAKQVWLYKNKFSESLIPRESWTLLLEYFESAKGNIRTMLMDDANKIIKQMDDWTESQKTEDTNDENEDTENVIQKPNEAVYKRARELLQFLQE